MPEIGKRNRGWTCCKGKTNHAMCTGYNSSTVCKLNDRYLCERKLVCQVQASTLYCEFCQNGSMSFPHMLIRGHRYSIKILLAAAAEEAVETGSSVKVLEFVGAQWAVAKEFNCW